MFFFTAVGPRSACILLQCCSPQSKMGLPYLMPSAYCFFQSNSVLSLFVNVMESESSLYVNVSQSSLPRYVPSRPLHTFPKICYTYTMQTRQTHKGTHRRVIHGACREKAHRQNHRARNRREERQHRRHLLQPFPRQVRPDCVELHRLRKVHHAENRHGRLPLARHAV